VALGRLRAAPARVSRLPPKDLLKGVITGPFGVSHIAKAHTDPAFFAGRAFSVIDGSNGGTPLPPVDRLGQTNLQEGDTHEFIITGAALVALAVPATSMASQPETPGGFDMSGPATSPRSTRTMATATGAPASTQPPRVPVTTTRSTTTGRPTTATCRSSRPSLLRSRLIDGSDRGDAVVAACQPAGVNRAKGT
jgi:hypothetical protein